MAFPVDLKSHLLGGCTTLAQAWLLRRSDGVVLGFTDHDRTLAFDGIAYQPDSGMTARALAQNAGLSVDNSECYGALSSTAITEEDIAAGRYDRAEVCVWLVNWSDVSQRALTFRGHLGEITRGAGAFTAEMRGLSEALGRNCGRVYHPRCSAVLGDRHCRFDLSQPGYSVEVPIRDVLSGTRLQFDALAGFAPRWFEKGRLSVENGAAKELVGVVKNDRMQADGTRLIELWERVGVPIASGDIVRIAPGCDRRAETCQLKFNNFLNFRGFPHIPGEDWMTSYPVESGTNDGGSLFR